MKKIVIVFFVLYLVFFNITTLNAAPPDISATAAIVIDAQQGFILYEKNIHEPRHPASIAKIMTALIALEQYGTRLYEPIKFSDTAVYSIPYGSSHIAMNSGETLTMEHALYAIMVSSANEVANAIAEHIAGDVESFGELMTRRARAIGAVNSRFKNPSGLHNPYQVTTAYDMAIITREALRHPKFVELISTIRHDIPPTERQPNVRELLNSNRMLRSGPHYNPQVIGGKTGFTTPSQHTLVTYATQDGRELIVVTLQGEGGRLYSDTQSLLNYAFLMPYVQSQIFSRNQQAQLVPVYNGWAPSSEQYGEVRLIVPEDVFVELPIDFDVSEVEYQIYTPSRLIAPIQAEQEIGRIVYSISGITLGDIQLRADNTVITPDLPVESYPGPTEYEPEAYDQESYQGALTIMEELAENYFLSILLPLIIFIVGLMMSIVILKAHNRRRARRYSILGSPMYRNRR